MTSWLSDALGVARMCCDDRGDVAASAYLRRAGCIIAPLPGFQQHKPESYEAWPSIAPETYSRAVAMTRLGIKREMKNACEAAHRRADWRHRNGKIMRVYKNKNIA